MREKHRAAIAQEKQTMKSLRKGSKALQRLSPGPLKGTELEGEEKQKEKREKRRKVVLNKKPQTTAIQEKTRKRHKGETVAKAKDDSLMLLTVVGV